MGMCCEKKMVRWRNVQSMKLRVQADQRGPGEVVREDCQARKLNKEDAMDRCKWRKLTKCVCSPGLPRYASTRKVKPIWSKRQWVAVASAGLYASLHLTSENHTSTPPLSFCRPDALPAAQPTASKDWRQLKQSYNCYYIHTLTCDLL